MIEVATFEIVSDIWKNKLWPNRTSTIDTHSAMLISGEYELKNYNYPATFFVYKINDTIVGCNSGHQCCDGSYRSRGLYVFPDYRKQGIGKKLLDVTIEQGNKEKSTFVWSYPRLESWSTYKAAGFRLVSEWTESETGINAYCRFP